MFFYIKTGCIPLSFLNEICYNLYFFVSVYKVLLYYEVIKVFISLYFNSLGTGTFKKVIVLYNKSNCRSIPKYLCLTSMGQLMIS